MASPFSREQAWDLLTSWVTSESLRRHVLAVEVAMRAYARHFGEDEELWGQTGLLHDLDYERFPSPQDGHPRHAIAELERLGYPPELVRAVASHADYLGVPRVTLMERALYAVDELAGFMLACAYVRPQGLVGLTPKSVRKKLRQPSFAAAVDREALQRGAQELGVPFDEHLALVAAALEQAAAVLAPPDAVPAGDAPADAVTAGDAPADAASGDAASSDAAREGSSG